MKKLITNIAGGHPLTLEDFGFIQESTREAFKALISSFLPSFQGIVVLKGIERSLSNGTVTLSEGYAFKNDEIFFFPGASYPEPANNQFELLVTTAQFQASGLKVFENGNSHNVYENKQLNLAVSPTDNAVENLNNIKRIFEVIASNLPIESFKSLPQSSNQYPNVGEPAAFMKDLSGIVHFKGFCTNEDPSGAGFKIGALPLGYRPINNIDFVYINKTAVNGGVFYNFRIKPDGDIISTDGVYPQTVNLNQFPSFKAV